MKLQLHVTQQVVASLLKSARVNQYPQPCSAKAFPFLKFPRMPCSSGLEFSEIFNVLLDEFSIDTDHFYHDLSPTVSLNSAS